jgi:hypothetical protein
VQAAPFDFGAAHSEKTSPTAPQITQNRQHPSAIGRPADTSRLEPE